MLYLFCFLAVPPRKKLLVIYQVVNAVFRAILWSADGGARTVLLPVAPVGIARPARKNFTVKGEAQKNFFAVAQSSDLRLFIELSERSKKIF